MRFFHLFFFPVYSKDDESFQNIWSNSTPTIFPFPNYYAASEFSTLATQHSLDIRLHQKKRKKKPCKHVFLVALNTPVLIHQYK